VIGQLAASSPGGYQGFPIFAIAIGAVFVIALVFGLGKWHRSRRD
jgi:hypothetical protein